MITGLPKKRALLLGVTITYVIWMISYYHVLANKFGIYLGYPYREVPIGWEICAVIIAVLPCFYIGMECKRPSDFIIFFVYYAMFLPSVIIPLYALKADFVGISLFNLFALVSLTIVIATRNIPLLALSRPKMREKSYAMAIGVVSALVLMFLVAKLGFAIKLHSLADVYDVREVYKGELSKLGGISLYLMMWAQFLIMPLLLVMGLRALRLKDRIQGIGFIAFGVSIGLYVFSVSAIKSSLVAVIFCLGVWFLVRREEGFAFRIAGSILLLCVLSNALALMTQYDFMYLHLVRRVLVTPGLNTGYYFEFFSNHDKMLLSHSVFSSLAGGIYDTSPGHVIGAYYYKASGNMTAGFIADAYANFGLLGMVVFGGLLSLVLWLVDSFSAHLDRQTAITVFAIQAYALVNSAFLTTLLSYGLVLMLFAVYMMPPKRLVSVRQFQYAGVS